MLSYISTPIVTGRHTHDTCEYVIQQATKSDRFVTRQGCQTVINDMHIQQTIRCVNDDLSHSGLARLYDRHRLFP